MKKHLAYLLLSGLVTTNIQTTEIVAPLTKKELVIQTFKNILSKEVPGLSLVKRGMAFAGEKITRNKIFFISTGILATTGIGLYLNKDKTGDMRSFNPLMSNFTQKMLANFKDGFNILDAVRILFGMKPLEKADIKNLAKEKQDLNQKVNSLNNLLTGVKNECQNLIKEKNDLCDKYNKDTNDLNKQIIDLKKEIQKNNLLIDDASKLIYENRNKSNDTIENLKNHINKLNTEYSNKIEQLTLNLQKLKECYEDLTKTHLKTLQEKTEYENKHKTSEEDYNELLEKCNEFEHELKNTIDRLKIRNEEYEILKQNYEELEKKHNSDI